MGVMLQYPNPYSGGYARIPPVLSGSRGIRMPVGPEGMGPHHLAQRRLHSGLPGSTRTTRGWGHPKGPCGGACAEAHGLGTHSAQGRGGLP